eukprot:CAMPEP_0179418036 /NCGR_PEP_ID=MMETSP0799-20121207/7728_1 /TAXON_ID=46947 /ORGANISM="Geminigera cryophila, Strain CCMP2564" /LENGTH=64 /DNA_ID=CAMNT_0021191169 /DNA_START=1 /DNA_END=193 /DNA_ORIENTATION=+
MTMLRRCEGGLRNDEFHEPVEDAAHPAGGVAEDASARAMTAGLAFPIVYPYPLLAALQACADIN